MDVYKSLWNFCDYDEIIRHAFETVCVNKMLIDGYCDMSLYIYGRMKKEDLFPGLISAQSVLAPLFKKAYPEVSTIRKFWYSTIKGDSINESILLDELFSDDTTIALVYWVYQTLKNATERIKFTEHLFQHIKALNSISASIKSEKGISYNSKTIDLRICSSFPSLLKAIDTIYDKESLVFYRGHSNANFTLTPSVSRTTNLIKNEDVLFNELLVRCPKDFEHEHTNFEKLVKMQHYGLPTRLLDITRNPLVAAYFACISNPKNYGEIILLQASPEQIKYPQSDSVAIISSLARINHSNKKHLAKLPQTSKDYYISMQSLVQAVSKENPAFVDEVAKKTLLSNFYVYAAQNNNRIIQQDGAFIICGLSDGSGTNPLNEFRLKLKRKTVVVLLEPSAKNKILRQLKNFSICKETLFPEIDSVANELRIAYQ